MPLVAQTDLRSKDVDLDFMADLPPDMAAWVVHRLDWLNTARWNQLPPPDVDWATWLLLAGRGSGKCLALDTPIPTPDGWTMMGELMVGDAVFDERGAPCTVAQVHPVITPTNSYRVHFGDGTFLDACGEHLWTTWGYTDRVAYAKTTKSRAFPDHWPEWRGGSQMQLGPQVRDTEEIRATLTVGKNQQWNHSIPLTRPLQLPTATDLPIDPWLLGYWLGNGRSRNGELTAGSWKGEHDGPEVAQYLETLGYGYSAKDGPGCTQFYVRGLTTQLRAAGQLGKEGPRKAYLRGSIAQRLSLLRGLMDADGYIHKGKQQAEFTSGNRQLADDVLELVRSLGERPCLTYGRMTTKGQDFGPRYRVRWHPSLFVPFSFRRKVRDCAAPGTHGREFHHRNIVAVEPIPPAPMRCITVTSASALYLAGEGMIPTHNTRSGAEYVANEAAMRPGLRVALVGATAVDPCRVQVEGESGLLAILGSPGAGVVKQWNRSTTELFLTNGSLFKGYSSEEPKNLRGPQHHIVWGDEFAAWKNMQETFDMAKMGLRLGSDPKMVLTTTPRPSALLKSVMSDPKTIVVRGTTYENSAHLPASFFEDLKRRYEGTRLGAQELLAQILENFDDAFLKHEDIRHVDEAPTLERIVVGVDPAGSHRKAANYTGIIAAGVDSPEDPQTDAYVIGDYSVRATPEIWARRAVEVYHTLNADCIIAEKNFGGDMVESVIRNVDPNVPVRLVHASKGKTVRAEPICMLYQQGRIKHVGHLPELEEQLTAFTPAGYAREGSPDRGDAAVWALSALMLNMRAGMHAVVPITVGSRSRSPWATH